MMHWTWLISIGFESLLGRTLALIILTCLTLIVLRRSSAGVRHAVLLAALAGLLLLPALRLGLAGWRVMLPIPSGKPVVISPQPDPLQDMTLPQVWELGQGRSGPALPAVVGAPDMRPTSVYREMPSANTDRFYEAPFEPARRSMPLYARAGMFYNLLIRSGTLLDAWASGAAICLIWFTMATARARRIVARSMPIVDDRTTALLPSGSPRVVLLSSTEVAIPVTWGASRAVIVLPADAPVEWPEERLRAVLLHELAHVRRRDWLSQLAGLFVVSVHWFNPLVWMLYARLRVEAEKACDDAVVSHGMSASSYAAQMIAVVQAAKGRKHLLGSVAMANAGAIKERISAMLDARLSRAGVTTRQALTLGTAAAMVSLMLTPGYTVPVAFGPTDPESSSSTVASEPVDPNNAEWTRTLANGVTVELMGITSSPNGGGEDGWWTPNGAPAGNLGDLPTSFYIANPGGDQYQRRTLSFRIVAGASSSVSMIGIVTDPNLSAMAYEGRTRRTNDVPLFDNRSEYGDVPIEFPTPTDEFSYKLGIAVGPWSTIAVTDNTLHPPDAIATTSDHVTPASIIELGNTPSVGYRSLSGQLYHLSLLPAGSSLGEVARRVVAVDATGNAVPLATPVFEWNGEAIHMIRPSDVRRIAKFRLQTRPYGWAEFDAVRNVPAIPAAPVM
jgi:Zn-dependent protease with chaperone function